MRRDVQAPAEGFDEHGGAGRGEEVVELPGGAVRRDGDARRVRGLEEGDAVVKGVRGEGRGWGACVAALGGKGVVDWGGAAEVFLVLVSLSTKKRLVVWLKGREWGGEGGRPYSGRREGWTLRPPYLAAWI